MAITRASWDGSPSRWPDAASYCKACLITRATGSEPLTKADCSLPVYEPNGDLNANGVHAAAGRLMQTDATPAQKKQAARKLRGLYGQLKEPVPASIKNMAQ
jgi:hypothetical protein